MFLIIPEKKLKGRCCAYRCKKKHKNKDRFCARHRHIYTKHKDPVAYTYHATRCNAKRRGKDWNLTLQEFREFCEQTDYIKLKGVLSNHYSIDRLDNSIGYQLDNIRCITNNQNSSKGSKEELPF